MPCRHLRKPAGLSENDHSIAEWLEPSNRPLLVGGCRRLGRGNHCPYILSSTRSSAPSEPAVRASHRHGLLGHRIAVRLPNRYCFAPAEHFQAAYTCWPRLKDRKSV